MGLLRPTFMGFETAKRSIEVNQKALDIVANNLTNADTAGYTRQRLDVSSIAPQAYRAKVAGTRIGVLGQGVEALGVGQIRDKFLDKRFREEYTKAAYHDQAAKLLKDVQAALGDGGDISDESVLFGSFARIFKSLNDYIYEPTLESQANIVMAAMRDFTQVMRHLDLKLNTVTKNLIEDVNLDVARVNEIFKEIAYYNEIISSDAEVMSNPYNEYFRPNELLDKRNLLLDELAAFGDIHVKELATGMINVEFAGKLAVNGKEHEVIRAETRSDLTIDIVWNATGQTLRLGGGTLKANLDFLNGRGRNIQNSYETEYEGVPYYRDRLNSLAVAFANVLNNTIPERAYPYEAGNNEPLRDAEGKIIYKTLIGASQDENTFIPPGTVISTGVYLPAGTLDRGGRILTEDTAVPPGYVLPEDVLLALEASGRLPKGIVPSEPPYGLKLKLGEVLPGGQGLITAGNITLSREWMTNGAGYFIFSKQENIVNYAQQLVNNLTLNNDTKFVSFGETFMGTFEEYVTDYVSKLGSQIKYQEGRYESTAMIADDFLDRRDEISGVSRDEETANMLIFQKSYNAAARLMTTLDDMVDIIINRMGRVGL